MWWSKDKTGHGIIGIPVGNGFQWVGPRIASSAPIWNIRNANYWALEQTYQTGALGKGLNNLAVWGMGIGAKFEKHCSGDFSNLFPKWISVGKKKRLDFQQLSGMIALKENQWNLVLQQYTDRSAYELHALIWLHFHPFLISHDDILVAES